jgi:hypothetical protein
MRLTIVRDDGRVNIDGISFSGLDLTFIDAAIHAVQWYDTHGEVEIKDPTTGRMLVNELITSIETFQPAIALWQAEKKAQEEADKVAAAAAAAAILNANNQPEISGAQTL